METSEGWVDIERDLHHACCFVCQHNNIQVQTDDTDRPAVKVNSNRKSVKGTKD